jgi:maleylacetate reductase
VIVGWGLDSLGPVLDEVGSRRPLVVASERWSGLELPVEPAGRWTEVPSERIDEATKAARDGDGVLAIGGGSAIDLGKAISAATAFPLVSVPTTYAGAEWTPYFGVRDPKRKMRGGGSGARLAAAVYEPSLTLDLPRAETVGTAMNALAHCAEALYVQGRNDEADAHALAGARLIGEFLPRVVEEPRALELRTGLLRGACEAGQALGGSMLALGHAMAQALGGRYGLPHGALNAICLPAALRFNEPVAPEALRKLAGALGTDDPIGRVEELARLGGFERLRDLGVPEDELDDVAEAVAVRPGAKANPRPASPEQIGDLLRSIH